MKMPTSNGIDRPFPSIPVCDRYLAIGSIEDARSRICRMIDRGEGLGIVVGPPGTGKTLLCQRIASQYRASHAIVMLGDMRVSSRIGLIQQVLTQLRISQKGLDEQTMQMVLVDSLTKAGDGTRNLLLIIDEAQMLSVDLLDEIRMLTNLIRDGRQMVQTILVGSHKLDDSLADPQMESLSQRIVARCYLHSMTHSETTQYLRSMLVTTGLTINDDAVGSVYHACAGVPRLINQLMNRSLDFAALHRKKSIDDICVQHAWADLQQLPSPMLESKLKTRSANIEFGELDSDALTDQGSGSIKVPVSRPAHLPSEGMRLADRQDVIAFDFEPPSKPVTASYFDMESILASQSIDCMPTSSSQVSTLAAKRENGIKPTGKQAPVVLKTTNTTIVPMLQKAERKRQRDDLFGIDFSDEILVDVRLADAAVRPMMSTPKIMDPASEEISLHSEILKMSRNAKEASSGVPRASLPWAPPVQFTRDNKDVLPMLSVDVPEPMAVIWRDDEPATIAMDDRDMLVIEEDVTVIVDPPSAGKIGTGAMRQPGQQIDQQYQNLFSRLRGNHS